MSKNLYWKIQTINSTDSLEVGSTEYEMYREKYKNYETKELMGEEETLTHYKLNAYKNPIYGKVYSLTLAYVEDNQIRVQYITGNEKDLIMTFFNTVNNEYFKEFTITHFGYEYLLPYLGTRIDMNQIKTNIPNDLKYRGVRPWNLTGFCIRDYYSGAGTYKPTLKELAYVFGLPCNVIEASEEYTYYLNGNFESLQHSAVEEIFTIINVHRAMMGETLVEDLTTNTIKVENVEEVKPTNFLALLYESQAMTLQVREGLEKQLKKKRLTKRDREVVKEIILGVYIQADFINGAQDTKAVIAKKTKEVEDFIASI